MKSLNRVTLLGNVGRDPEVKATAGGTTVANFSLATTKGKKDAAGNWQDVTEWHNLVSFGKTAEVIRDYVSKGSRLYVEGELQTRSWDDKKTGEKKYRTEIVIHDISLLTPKKDDGQNGGYTRTSDTQSYAQYATQQAVTPIDLEDVPF